MNVYFFNAGKADAAIICTDEAAVVIDTGETGFGAKILAYMQASSIPSLDCLIITHFDKDHVGGAAELIRSTEVKKVLISNCPKESSEYQAFAKALEEKGIEAEIVFGEEPLAFTIDSMAFIVDGPDQETYEKDPSNNSSLITSVTYRDASFLFAGDSENERILEYLEDYEGTYDVLKVPYHGRYNKQLGKLLEEAKPSCAVITCSEEEGGEEKTLSLLEKQGIPYYLTYNGGILITAGEELKIRQ